MEINNMEKWMEINNMEVVNNNKEATYIAPNKTKATPYLIIIISKIKHNNNIKDNNKFDNNKSKVGLYTGPDQSPLITELKFDSKM